MVVAVVVVVVVEVVVVVVEVVDSMTVGDAVNLLLSLVLALVYDASSMTPTETICNCGSRELSSVL